MCGEMRTIRLLDERNRYQARYGKVFRRDDVRIKAAKYVRGLMGGTERKNGWHLAEQAGDERPDGMQRLLYRDAWDADEARDELQHFVIEEMGSADGIGILDETGFIKKGEYSAGVARQYTGTAGKIENCQIGTFLAYASADGSTLIDRRLYLPEAWTSDEARRERAQIPDEVVFQTKPEHGREMLSEAWERGVPMRWVTGDEVYGNAPELRNAIDTAGKEYVLAVASNTRIRLVDEGPKKLANTAKTESHAIKTVADVAQTVNKWERLCVTVGEKGPIIYDWAMVRVWEQVDKATEREAWLLIRRSVSDEPKLAYYLSNAARQEKCSTLAKVASTRFNIELCFEHAKGEVGLDQYEVRRYQSWYRHITLSMMALAFLVVVCGRATQVEIAIQQEQKKR